MPGPAGLDHAAQREAVDLRAVGHDRALGRRLDEARAAHRPQRVGDRPGAEPGRLEPLADARIVGGEALGAQPRAAHRVDQRGEEVGQLRRREARAHLLEPDAQRAVEPRLERRAHERADRAPRVAVAAQFGDPARALAQMRQVELGHDQHRRPGRIGGEDDGGGWSSKRPSRNSEP